MPWYCWECSVLNNVQNTKFAGQTARYTMSASRFRNLFESRTHGWRSNEEPPSNASNAESDQLGGHDDHPLIPKAEVLVIIHPLYRNDICLAEKD